MTKVETNNVVERLRAKKQVFPAQGGGGIGTDARGNVTVTSYVTDDGYRLVNPDGPEAAGLIQSLSDRIDVLEGENAALRAKRKLKVVPAPPVVFEDETASLTQGGKS